MKDDYGAIYRLSGAFMDGFPFDDEPITRAYLAIKKLLICYRSKGKPLLSTVTLSVYHIVK